MKKSKTLTSLVAAWALVGPAHFQRGEKQRHQQQSEFSMEKEIVPVQEPLTLRESAVHAMEKDSAVSSCVANEKIADSRVLASWFVA